MGSRRALSVPRPDNDAKHGKRNDGDEYPDAAEAHARESTPAPPLGLRLQAFLVGRKHLADLSEFVADTHARQRDDYAYQWIHADSPAATIAEAVSWLTLGLLSAADADHEQEADTNQHHHHCRIHIRASWDTRALSAKHPNNEEHHANHQHKVSDYLGHSESYARKPTPAPPLGPWLLAGGDLLKRYVHPYKLDRKATAIKFKKINAFGVSMLAPPPRP